MPTNASIARDAHFNIKRYERNHFRFATFFRPDGVFLAGLVFALFATPHLSHANQLGVKTENVAIHRLL